MVENIQVDENRLMVEYDFIMHYAEKNGLNEFQMETDHKLSECGEREHYKSFTFALKMLRLSLVTMDMFLPWKNLPFVERVAVTMNSRSCATGIIMLKRLMSRRELHQYMVNLFSNSEANIVLCSSLSMNTFNKRLLTGTEIV